MGGNKGHPRIVKYPSDDEARIAFEDYALAVGKVSFAWNFLHERLGRLFATVCGGARNIHLGVWYSTESDRAKQHMLMAAIVGRTDWPKWVSPERKGDLESLAAAAIKLGEDRNNAIHAPCILSTDADGTKMVAAPDFYSPHGRAKKMRGKALLIEFDYLERWTESLSRFSDRLESALLSETAPWPDRPAKPDRRPKKERPPSYTK